MIAVQPAAVLNPARRSIVLARLFPPGVGTGELRCNADTTLLLPEERWAARMLRASSLAAFAAGRLCARRAVAGVGFIDYPIAANADRSPRWPGTVVGSITHAAGFCGAVAANRDQYEAVGVDAQTIGAIMPEHWPSLLTPSEIESLNAYSPRRRVLVATIMFSAKRAALTSRSTALAGSTLHDIVITITEREHSSGTFTLRRAPGESPVRPIDGHFRIDPSVVLTGMAFARVDTPAPAAILEIAR
jgi:4'-phosphopantetheinyl transferase EntD